MSRRTGVGACIGLMTTIAVAVSAFAAAQVLPGERATAVPVAVGSGAPPAELQAWDARFDGMLRTGERVVASRTHDPALPGRTHEYAAQPDWTAWNVGTSSDATRRLRLGTPTARGRT